MKYFCNKNTPSKVTAIEIEVDKLQKIKKGAKDFAVRFEKVMKELANG